MPRFMGSGGAVLLTLLVALAACRGGEGFDVDAGPDQQVVVGSVVQLEPVTPKGSAYTYRWKITSRPSGSDAALANDSQAGASFTPDVEGSYAIQLVVRDGNREGTDTVLVTVLQNRAPIASAGDDRVVAIGARVELDGRASSDPEGANLTFEWALVERPAESAASLNNPTGRTPTFTADVAGLYRVSLTVGDGVGFSTVTLTVRANRAPVASAGVDVSGRIGEVLPLDGSASHDDDGDPLTYAWSIISGPAAYLATLTDSTEATARFSADAVGSYLVELVVSDGHAEDASRIAVVVSPASGVIGSVVYVSPAGDDGNTGAVDAPLATIGAAFQKTLDFPALTRIQVAAGVYSEPFNHSLTNGLLEVVGPASGTAKLVAPGVFFRLANLARISLNQVTLETPDLALFSNGNSTRLALTGVTCRAKNCVRAGANVPPATAAGGSVELRSSTLEATSAAGTTGVAMLSGTSLLILDSSISGYGTGIDVTTSNLMLKDSELSDNTVGLRIVSNPASNSSLIEGSTFESNSYGFILNGSRNVILRDTGIYEGLHGIVVDTSTMTVQGGALQGLGGTPLDIRDDSTVTVRGIQIDGNAGPGVLIKGKTSNVDLGSQAVPGNNRIEGHSSNAAIYDTRPAAATGLVSLSATRLDGVLAPAGTFTGPHNANGLYIKEAGNKIRVY